MRAPSRKLGHGTRRLDSGHRPLAQCDQGSIGWRDGSDQNLRPVAQKDPPAPHHIPRRATRGGELAPASRPAPARPSRAVIAASPSTHMAVAPVTKVPTTTPPFLTVRSPQGAAARIAHTSHALNQLSPAAGHVSLVHTPNGCRHPHPVRFGWQPRSLLSSGLARQTEHLVLRLLELIAQIEQWSKSVIECGELFVKDAELLL